MSQTVTTGEALYEFKGVLDHDKWYYKLQAEITGSGENITTTTKILRSYESGGTFDEIGTYDNNKINLWIFNKQEIK